MCLPMHGGTRAETKKLIDWDKRQSQFIELVNQSRLNNTDYDCIVPWSGGKDSSTIAYRLKFEFGLNPLLVTFSPLMPNTIGETNRATLGSQPLACKSDSLASLLAFRSPQWALLAQAF